jgi:hypothetical protein
MSQEAINWMSKRQASDLQSRMAWLSNAWRFNVSTMLPNTYSFSVIGTPTLDSQNWSPEYDGCFSPSKL